MNYFIVFNDHAVKEVSEQQANFLMEKSCEPGQIGIKIDGSFIKYSSVAKILSENEYFKQYPDKRPPKYTIEPDNTIFLPNQMDRILSPIENKEKRIRAVTEMMKGLKKYIDGPNYQGTDKPIKLYDQMARKLAEIKGDAVPEQIVTTRKKPYDPAIEQITDPAQRKFAREAAWAKI